MPDRCGRCDGQLFKTGVALVGLAAFGKCRCDSVRFEQGGADRFRQVLPVTVQPQFGTSLQNSLQGRFRVMPQRADQVVG